MVAHNVSQKDISTPIPAVETRRGELMAEQSHSSLMPDVHGERPWLAHYHQGLPGHVSHPHQRMGMGGMSLSQQRPGRGRR